MILLVTILAGISLLAVGFYQHAMHKENLDDVYTSSLESVVDEAMEDVSAQAESDLIEDILKDDFIKEDLMAFTQINQRNDKQIPLVGLPDKALFRIH